MRKINDFNILSRFCNEFTNVIYRYTDYIIVSGFVAISTGRTRGTEDIDMIIKRIDEKTFFKMHESLEKNNFVCMQSDDPKEIYREYLSNNDSVRYTWKDKPLPEMELKFSKDLLDDYQLKTKIKIPLSGLDIWFSSIEMNIAFKEELLKSDKDLEDARHLRIVFSDIINEKEITKIKKMINEYRLK